MNILPDSNYEKIYTGSAIKAKFLQTLLEDEGIKPFLRDDEESARTGGFGMDYANGIKMFVHKNDLLKSKHIVNNALDENGDIIAISEEELEAQAMNGKERTLNIDRSETSNYKRSPFNLLLNVAIIIYSIWRLSPLLDGETLPTWRIALSGALIVFSGWALVKHFTAKNA